MISGWRVKVAVGKPCVHEQKWRPFTALSNAETIETNSDRTEQKNHFASISEHIFQKLSVEIYTLTLYKTQRLQ
jgi:hypothetical protein